MITSEFYNKTNAFLSTIGEGGKSWKWLFDQFQLSENHRYALRNGFKEPSLVLIFKVAVILREHGCNIFSPKQIIPTPFSVKLADRLTVSDNVNELCDRHIISASDIYNTEICPKNTVLNILRKSSFPRYDALQKLLPFFEKKGIVSKVSDFIYFPAWGENAFSYLEYRNKYKL
jgi:hypothetical protein